MVETIETLLRFLHILAGITWIGLLYFFNFVNVPLFKFDIKNPTKVDMNAKAGPDLSLKTIWWFRWAAMLTLIFGLLLLDQVSRRYGSMSDYFATFNGQAIMIGAGLGIIMWFNVWFLIWPNQKVILGNLKKIAEGNLSEAQKKELEADNARRAPTAKNASRFNTYASWPMLFFMVFAAHGPAIW